MAARNPQTFAKRAREIAVKERRDRKRAKKAEAAAARRAASGTAATSNDSAAPDTDAHRVSEDDDLRPPAP